MSMVRNVALAGRPSAGPVIASTSSIVYRPLATASSAHNAVQRDVIADEVGRIFRNHYALAKMPIGEFGDHRQDRRIRVRCRDDLEQPQIARRVEEVRPEPLAAELG